MHYQETLGFVVCVTVDFRSEHLNLADFNPNLGGVIEDITVCNSRFAGIKHKNTRTILVMQLTVRHGHGTGFDSEAGFAIAIHFASRDDGTGSVSDRDAAFLVIKHLAVCQADFTLFLDVHTRAFVIEEATRCQNTFTLTLH
mmetsp:Transcript_6668/g.15328  ORF Transcript_6668/g.15328 Transcript_6668/m.15328 type:complete len:142 (-) Transcript_6668:812-1237(-)